MTYAYGSGPRVQRERQHALACGVAACLLMGKTLREMGPALGISQSLADRVVQRLRRHYGAGSRAELVDAIHRDCRP